MISSRAFRFAAVIGLLGVFLAVLAPMTASAQPPPRRPTPNDTLKSTEVAPDRKVSFRIYAPKAEEVSVGGDFGQGGKMTKDDRGVWSLTVGPLTPDFYFCGQHSEEGKPYCDFHSRRAYHQLEKKKRKHPPEAE